MQKERAARGHWKAKRRNFSAKPRISKAIRKTNQNRFFNESLRRFTPFCRPFRSNMDKTDELIKAYNAQAEGASSAPANPPAHGVSPKPSKPLPDGPSAH